MRFLAPKNKKKTKFGRPLVCGIANIVHVLTVHSLTSETLHLRGEKTAHINSGIIITGGLGVPLSTGPSTILFDVCFLFYITSN